jgi:tetratricopeptide (TPR) repeat protein
VSWAARFAHTDSNGWQESLRVPYLTLLTLVAETIAMKTGVALKSHVTNALEISVALGAAVTGLGALAAASLGETGLYLPGLACLAVGGATAATLRWRREREALDQQAVAELEAARARLAQEDHTEAAAAASRAAKSARTPRTRNAALTTLAWAALGQGYPERAKAALDEIVPAHAIDLYSLAAVDAARGRPEQAIEALEVARTARTLTCDGAKLFVDCCARLHGVERAVTAALQTIDLLGVENCKVVAKAAADAGAHRAAANLTSAIRGRALRLSPAQGVHAT